MDQYFDMLPRSLHSYIRVLGDSESNRGQLTSAAGLSAIVTLWLSAVYISRRRSRRNNLNAPLPPGPKPLPIIGNLLQMPAERTWEVYNEWRKDYGDIFFVSALGTNILVVNSIEAVNDLFGARAANYSDRPYSPIPKLVGLDWAISLLNHGQEWRARRRLFHRALNYTQTHRYHHVMETEIQRFLPRLLANPKEHRSLLRYLLAAIILRVAYGSDDYDYNTTLADSAEISVQGFFKSSDPRALLVNTLHSLRFVPSWLPGAGWKRKLAGVAEHSLRLLHLPYEATKDRMKLGTQADYSALAVQFMEALPKEADPDFKRQEEDARTTVSTAYIAGADTSISSVYAMVFALAKHPEVQRRAQEEVDTVVGVGKLPTMADVPHLTYIQAIVKETTRWHTVMPHSLPRCTKQEDVYNGYRIPANTIVLPNTWAIMHDPKTFESPMEFKPERYLTADGKIDSSVPDGDHGAFGYGRRICPGRHFSNENLQLLAATLLSCFNIGPSVDEKGAELPLEMNFIPSLIMLGFTYYRTPLPYDCSFVPRSQKHVDLIRSLGV